MPTLIERIRKARRDFHKHLTVMQNTRDLEVLKSSSKKMMSSYKKFEKLRKQNLKRSEKKKKQKRKKK